MTALEWLRNSLLALHFLAAIGWVGGMLATVAIVRPALALLDANARIQTDMQALFRLHRLTWHLMPTMLVTGWLMVFSAWGGFAVLPLSINIMQGLGLLMALVFLYTWFGPLTRLRRAVRPTAEHIAAVRKPLMLNLGLGVATIIAGSLGHVWG